MKIFAIFILILITIYSGVYSRTSNPELNKSLVAAARTGNLSRVKQLVNDGADINAITEGFLPLVEAINNKHTQTAEYIINKGALVNLQDKDGDTAIIVAALRGNLEIIKLLKQKGADFNIQNNNGKNALIYGVYNGNVVVVEYLLNNGSDVIQQDKSGEDAVSMAIKKKDEIILKLLLTNGGVVTLKHRKLAFSIICIESEENSPCGNRVKYPKIAKLLNNVYSIKKNIEYKKYYSLKSVVVSKNKQQKVELYNNGVIKIINLLNNKFVKAFGGLQGVKSISLPIFNKIFIEKKYSIKIECMKGRMARQYTALVTYDTEYMILTISNGEVEIIAYTFSHGTSTMAHISTSGRYYLKTYTSCATGLRKLELIGLLSKNIYFSWDYKDGFERYSTPSALMAFEVKFSNHDKYFVINAYQALFVFSLTTRKLKFVKKFAFQFQYIFSSDDKYLFVKPDNAPQIEIPLN